MSTLRTLTSLCVVMAAIATNGYGDITIPGLPPAAAGTDGALTVTTNFETRTIDLSQAVSGSWDADNSANAGKGVYDATKWAVVFKYSAVTIGNTNSDINLKFTNHPTRAPVVWLVSGNVTITPRANVVLDGANSMNTTGFAEPGPGGSRGGRGQLGTVLGSAGFGPGGGDLLIGTGFGGGSYGGLGQVIGVTAAPMYGHAFILPLIGGSGGSADSRASYLSYGGGAGGGAILIMATGTITVNGQILARGGSVGNYDYGSAGSGGAIRLVANLVQGTGLLRATGGWARTSYGLTGGTGRILVQANTNSLTDAGDPPIVTQAPIADPLLLWPAETAPKIIATSLTVGGLDVPVPADPRASLNFPLADLAFDTTQPVTVNIAATNVPLTWPVIVRVVAKSGNSFSMQANPLQGTDAASTTTAAISTLPRGFGTIQVRAYKP